jgi:hypothetical protein
MNSPFTFNREPSLNQRTKTLFKVDFKYICEKEVYVLPKKKITRPILKLYEIRKNRCGVALASQLVLMSTLNHVFRSILFS